MGQVVLTYKMCPVRQMLECLIPLVGCPALLILIVFAYFSVLCFLIESLFPAIRRHIQHNHSVSDICQNCQVGSSVSTAHNQFCPVFSHSRNISTGCHQARIPVISSFSHKLVQQLHNPSTVDLFSLDCMAWFTSQLLKSTKKGGVILIERPRLGS